MCLNSECKYIAIAEDEFGDRYVGHYKYGKDNTTYELFWKQYFEASKSIKIPKYKTLNKTLKKQKSIPFQHPQTIQLY